MMFGGLLSTSSYNWSTIGLRLRQTHKTRINTRTFSCICIYVHAFTYTCTHMHANIHNARMHVCMGHSVVATHPHTDASTVPHTTHTQREHGRQHIGTVLVREMFLVREIFNSGSMPFRWLPDTTLTVLNISYLLTSYQVTHY
jgi:hypothetical protein